MYEFEQRPAELIGSFSVKRDEDFKNGFKALCESMQGTYNLDPFQNINNILKNPTYKEVYKDQLIGDVMQESIEDPYFNTHIQKLEQLFENSAYEILEESAAMGQLSPIVGTSLPILKKNYLDCVSKDIVLTEVPTTPIIKNTFERKFLKDRQGNKYYIPEIFYDNTYKTVLTKAKGQAFPDEFLPDATDNSSGITFPLHDYDLLGKVGGSIEKRDTLSLNIAVSAVKMTVGSEQVEVALQGCIPDLGANNTFYQQVTATNSSGETATDYIMGRIDFYTGKVSVSSTNGKITAVKFSGNLSNENNNNTLELDRERETKTWQIGDGEKLNSGLTTEKIKDYKALLDIDIAAETVSDMSDVLTQAEDSNILNFVRDSYEVWKTKKQLPFGYTEGFTEESIFSCVPPTTISIPGSQWLNSELKFNISRFIDKLKLKLKEQDIMFVIAGHPNNVTLIDDSVNWIIDTNTKMGGVQFNYSFGVLTDSKDRVHVVSSLKIPESEGFMVIAYPLSKKVITFKHYKYSMSIENGYRNPFTPLTPNIMATSRYLTTELLPVQGRFRLKDNSFGIVQKP